MSSKSEDGFIREYAAAIAEALREQDETPRQISIEESVGVLYRTLCFDEPLIDEVTIPNLPTVAAALSRQLTSPQSPYALSNRLINGIVYVNQKRENRKKDDKESPTEGSTSTAMAKLLYAALIRVPLECCQHLHDLERAKPFLGSYKGSVQPSPDTPSTANEESKSDERIQEQVDRVVEAMEGQTLEPSTNNNATEQDSTGEVWAAESDPSDYDYGEESPSQIPIDPVLQDEDWLDPLKLSKPDPQLSLEEARSAIGSLLQQANYTLLAPIFVSKHDLNTMTAQLTQLLLTLLKPQDNLLSSDGDMDASFQDAILSPLWILRDAALDASAKEQQRALSLAYLDVLQTLLAVDEAHLQDTATTGNAVQSGKNDLCSASIVGLSALSSWCSSVNIDLQATCDAVMDSMNDLSHVVERAGEAGYRAMLPSSLSPILSVLTGVSYDEKKNPPQSSSPVAQALLNSGLLRLLLSLACDDQPLRYEFHHSLWGLCVVYPKVVGKYVARFPGIPTLVRRYAVQPDSSSTHCVHSILWNCYGYIQCADASQQASLVSLKSSKGAPREPKLSNDECQEVCQKAWSKLCQIVETSVENAPNEPKAALETLQEWERLYVLVAVPSVAQSFRELMQDQQQQLAVISQALAGVGEINDEVDETPIESENAEEESDKKTSTQLSIRRAASTTRKLVKQYTLFFQGNPSGVSKTD